MACNPMGKEQAHLTAQHRVELARLTSSQNTAQYQLVLAMGKEQAHVLTAPGRLGQAHLLTAQHWVDLAMGKEQIHLLTAWHSTGQHQVHLAVLTFTQYSGSPCFACPCSIQPVPLE